MKKLIIALCLISGISKAQNPLAFTTVRYVTDTLFTGDSLKVNFTYTINSSPSGDMVQLRIHNASYSQLCLNSTPTSLYPIYKCKSDTDGTIYLMVKITPAMGTGYTRIIGNMGEKTTFIKAPIVIGINELSKQSEQVRKYYDLMGNEIEQRYNELIIERIGTKARKVYISQ